MWGSEITWDIDGPGPTIHNEQAYSSNSVYTQSICLTPGIHHLHLHDSFGDGWNGGVMTISPSPGNCYSPCPAGGCVHPQPLGGGFGSSFDTGTDMTMTIDTSIIVPCPSTTSVTQLMQRKAAQASKKVDWKALERAKRATKDQQLLQRKASAPPKAKVDWKALERAKRAKEQEGEAQLRRRAK